MRETVTVASERGPREYQEDRYVVSETARGLLLAVLDGHGGAEVADHVATVLPAVVERAWTSATGPDDVLRRAIVMCAADTARARAGTTLSVVLLPSTQTRAWVAVLGDSPVVALDASGKRHVSPEHNVRSNRRERRQALARGAIYAAGYLMDPITRRGLQMSRALGDCDLARFLSREPEIYGVALGPRSVIILATDGVFDPRHGPTHALVAQAVALVRSGGTAEDLVGRALERGSPDNATAIVWRATPAKERRRASPRETPEQEETERASGRRAGSSESSPNSRRS
jgi:serine/threonine protein phosphatase PrpC